MDGNRCNNAADNLEMCTHQRNMEHAIAGGLKNDYGEKSRNAKLTNAQAEEIRVMYHAGGISQETLARKYGVCRQTVSAI
ncbi:UNVERIFIED_CONTAM: HNH endonuclease, partial [Prevotella sp. 15_C9]